MKKFPIILSIFLIALIGCNDSNVGDYDYASNTAYDDDVSSYQQNKSYYDEELVDDAYDDPSGGQTPLSDDLSTTTPTDQTGLTTDELDAIGRKIIRNGDVSLELSDYQAGLKHIKDTIAGFDCEITSEAENNYSSYISNTIVIRVKSSQFDSLLSAVLSGNGKIISKNIYSDDVTQQYVDVFLRLKNKKAVAERYRDLLKRANTINEILNVEQYLRIIEEEIESAEGLLMYWDNQASYSTLTVSLTYYGEETPIVSDSFFNKLFEGIKMGWEGILMFILGLVTVWPLWILIGIVIFVISRQVKKKRAKSSIKK